jgi:SNF2 family DNA or RNA helicase
MWWNPALEDQAFDRVHRLGQTRDVNIYKLTIENTVEQRILTLQESKRALATATLGGDKINKLKLDLEDLMALFRPGREEDDD